MLISFDGLDSSGKATQVEQAIARLRAHGMVVHHFATPDYTTPIGRELKLLLQGKKPGWRQLDWRKKNHFFAENRAENKELVVNALAAGEVVVYDRYVPSSMAFMAVEASAHGGEGPARADVYEWVRQIEHQKFGMPQEDISIFLDVPPRQAVALLSQRKVERSDEDEYTDSIAVQEALYREYEYMTAGDSDHYWRIPCIRDGKLESIEVIATTIWDRLEPLLPKPA